MADPIIRYCQTDDGVNIAYFAIGEGMPLIWLPTVPFHHLQLDLRSGGQRREMVENVSSSVQLITYDSRGCGLSDRGTGSPSLDSYELDLNAVASAVGAERFGLIGATQATPLAISYSANHPERVSHLCLAAPFATGAEIYRLPAAQSLKALRSQDWTIYTETAARVLRGWDNTDEAVEFAAYMRECVTQDDARAIWAAVEEFDVADALQRIRATTLVIAFDNPWVPVELSRKVAAGIPAASLTIIEPAGSDLTGEVRRMIEQFILGSDGAAPTPIADSSGAVEPALRTVLFTDLVGHTEMMSRLGDERGRAVLREHERITREVLAAHGGTEVKTMGDGFMASFGSVTKAVECAVALQRKFEVRREKLEVEDLAVRIGLNAGEPIEEDGDLFGATVILASRIAAEAEGGEILVSDTVRGLCSGKGFLFADRGEFEAKGFDEAVRVYEVRWRE